jgi:DNA-binding transcriptional ArsR family regulator
LTNCSHSHFFRTGANSELARQLLEERRKRELFLPATMFAEVPWDCLLLLIMHEEQVALAEAVFVAELGKPQSTITRWLDYLEGQGLCESLSGELSDRAIKLTVSGVKALCAYFDYLRTPERLTWPALVKK